MATCDAQSAERFSAHSLASRLERVDVGKLSPGESVRVLAAIRPFIASHHGVHIDEEVERAALERSLSMDGFLPAKALTLLDLAAARASSTGTRQSNRWTCTLSLRAPRDGPHEPIAAEACLAGNADKCAALYRVSCNSEFHEWI